MSFRFAPESIVLSPTLFQWRKGMLEVISPVQRSAALNRGMFFRIAFCLRPSGRRRGRSPRPPSSFRLLGQEFKRIGCPLCWLCMKEFPEGWIIILWAVYPWENFPHPHLIGRVGDKRQVTLLSSRPRFLSAMQRDVA